MITPNKLVTHTACLVAGLALGFSLSFTESKKTNKIKRELSALTNLVDVKLLKKEETFIREQGFSTYLTNVGDRIYIVAYKPKTNLLTTLIPEKDGKTKESQ